MLGKISSYSPAFTGTIKAYYTRPSDLATFEDLTDYCDASSIPYEDTFIRSENAIRRTMVSDTFSDDNYITGICEMGGVKYEFIPTGLLMDHDEITARTVKPPCAREDEFLASMDVDLLGRLQKKYMLGNAKWVPGEYYRGCDKKVDFMIRCGAPIPATSVKISPLNGLSADYIVSYLEKFGEKRLREDQIKIDILRRTDKPDYCVCHGMKNLGMKEVPVCVDEETYKIGKALRLFK